MSKLKSVTFILSFYPIFLLVKSLTLFFKLIQIKNIVPKKKKTVLYFENFPVENAGYQYRSQKWSDILNQNGFKSKVKTTVASKDKFEKLITKQFPWFLIRSMFIRFIQILQSIHYETIIVRRELLLYNDYGNLFMEKLLFSLHKNIILDFDDDIAAAKKEGRKISLFGKLLLEKTYKFTKSITFYDKFFVCSKKHVDFIKKNKRFSKIEIIPTCVDYEGHSTKKYNNLTGPLNIGWIGSSSNQKYLSITIDALNNINKHHKIVLHVISGKPYKESLANFDIINYVWKMETQIQNMLYFDIGIMPLKKNNVVEGKCGFKLIQYMGLGIVSIANDFGINKNIINHGVNGFIVRSNNEWEEIFNLIIKKKHLLSAIGQNARKTVLEKYSFQANAKKYIANIYDKK